MPLSPEQLEHQLDALRSRMVRLEDAVLHNKDAVVPAMSELKREAETLILALMGNPALGIPGVVADMRNQRRLIYTTLLLLAVVGISVAALALGR